MGVGGVAGALVSEARITMGLANEGSDLVRGDSGTANARKESLVPGH